MTINAECIEITPAMIEAGYRAMLGIAHLADGDSPTEVVCEVYRAMEIARNSVKTARKS